MPFGSIKVIPGVNTIATPTLNEAGISVSNLIRFRGGLVEKMGGWVSFIPTAMDSLTRALHAFQAISGNSWLGVGNEESVKAISGQVVTDVTPQVITSNCPVNVSTTRGSRIVTIVDTNITNIQAYSSVFFNTPIAVGGLVLQGNTSIRPTPSINTYSIEWPYPATSTVANGGATPVLTTVLGSPLVQITLTDHSVVDGGTFVLPVSTTVGGISVSGVYKNCRKIDDDNFYITAANSATSAATSSMISNTNGAQLYYGVANGPQYTVGAGAFGPLGQFAIGEGYRVTVTVVNQTGTRLTASDWTLDNWGEILLACPDGGQIWYWSPTSGYASMLPVGTGPAFNTGIFVAMPAQILVCYGSTSGINSGNTDAAQDKLIVRWSDQLDFTNFRVSSLTQAGSFHIPTGSEIRGGIQGPGRALIFTDIDVWAMDYIGYPDVFGFSTLFNSGGLVGKHAVCQIGGAVYWMSHDNFYKFASGGVTPMPCTVWDLVFQDVDNDNIHKCVAAANHDFGEVTFFYPSVSGGTGECDKYVKVNVLENNIWDHGSLARSAWANSNLLGEPVGSDPTDLMIYGHEQGYSANGVAMNSFFETGYFPIGTGEDFVFVDELQPDMKFTTSDGSTPDATVDVTLTAVNYPTSASGMTAALTMTSTTHYLTPRVRGRQAKWRVGSNDATSWWRTGNLRYRYSGDGRR